MPLAYLEGREKAERGQAVVVHISAQTEVVRNSLGATEKQGTQCQACKMLVNFFLRNGKGTQYFSDLPKIPNFVRRGLVSRTKIHPVCTSIKYWDVCTSWEIATPPEPSAALCPGFPQNLLLSLNSAPKGLTLGQAERPLGHPLPTIVIKHVGLILVQFNPILCQA